jgi:hypothetical protein
VAELTGFHHADGMMNEVDQQWPGVARVDDFLSKETLGGAER